MYRRSIRNLSLSETAVCFLTEPIEWISFAAQHPTSIAFSRAQSRASFPSSSPLSSRLRSISRPPSRSASMFLCSSSSAPTRSSSSRSLSMHFAAPAQVSLWHLATLRRNAPFRVVIGGIADMPRASRTFGCDATDPQPTKAPSKSRSAVGLPQCYLALRSTGEIAGETARVHYAARRRGGIAARGARAAAGDARGRVHEFYAARSLASSAGRYVSPALV